MEQKEFMIKDLILPYLEDEIGETYYPIKHIYNKLFGRDISQTDNEGIQKYLIKLEIVYNNNIRNTQLTGCLTYKDCQEFLKYKKFKIGIFDSIQILRYNELMQYFKLDKLIFKINNKYNKIEQLLIYKCDNISNEKICINCHKIYPCSTDFFIHDIRAKDKTQNKCTACNTVRLTELQDNIYWFKRYVSKCGIDNDLLNFMLSNKDILIELYKTHIDKAIDHFQDLLSKENIIFSICEWLYKENKITPYNLNNDVLEQYKIYLKDSNIPIQQIYKLLFDDEPNQKPWLYPNYTIINIDKNKTKNIFFNYIHTNNINIDDVYNFKYQEIINKCGLKKYANHDLLQFVMNLYDNQYIAYKFNIASENYWKNKENRIKALKDCIEKDMKIPIEKIPLYLTKFSLRKVSSKLYNILHKGTYYKNLFEWVNEVYPDKFIEADFIINARRSEFDSHEEMLIDELLRENTENVIYNERKDNNDNVIKIDGMCPDWIIIGQNNCWLVEYFGLYVNRNSSTMISQYIEKTHRKILKYKHIEQNGNYKFLDLYPDDLKNNFEGLKNKIKIIS